MSLSQTVSNIKKYSLTELSLLRLEIDKIEKNRKEEFLKAIETSDVKKIRNFFDLEIDFKNGDFWHNLYRINLTNVNKKTLNCLLFEDFNVIEIKISELPVMSSGMSQIMSVLLDGKKDKTSISPLEILRELLKISLENHLVARPFTNEFFKNGFMFLGKERVKKLNEKIIKNFASFPDFGNFKDVHNYIKSNSLGYILFDNISNNKNLNFFKKDKDYMSLFNFKLDQDLKTKLMHDALVSSYKEKIEFLIKNKIDFIEDKSPYSILFSKSIASTIEAQEYVIENIKDIKIGSQVILKTILSFEDSKKINLIIKILDRYTDFEDLISVFNKREKTAGVLLVEKYYNYNVLNNEVPIGDRQNKPKLKI